MEHQHDEQIIDLEVYAKEGKQVPKGHTGKYRIKIDSNYYVVEKAHITGRELLHLAGLVPPKGYRVDQKLRGGATKKIDLDEHVDLATPGVERFITLKLDNTEG